MKKIILFLTSILTSCTTYYIPIDSFKEQFSDTRKYNMQKSKIRNPYGYIFTEETNSIDSIRCIDKNGNPKILTKKASLEIRFTENNNKKSIFYFDTIYLQDTLIYGQQSRFINAPKTISINDVKKIEIQDGHKKFRYE